MPTLEEIAELSGVSRSTVSRVINNDPHVSKQTREQVMAIVKELNYQPNAVPAAWPQAYPYPGVGDPRRGDRTLQRPLLPHPDPGRYRSLHCKGSFRDALAAEPEYERRTIRQVLHNGMVDGVIVSSMLIDDPIVKS
jgi:LacI family transcriptional regulator